MFLLKQNCCSFSIESEFICYLFVFLQYSSHDTLHIFKCHVLIHCTVGLASENFRRHQGGSQQPYLDFLLLFSTTFNNALFYCKNAFLQSHPYYFLTKTLAAGWDQLHYLWAEPLSGYKAEPFLCFHGVSTACTQFW